MVRYCTMPNIPFFRDWYEKKFSSLCKQHDDDYETKKCKLCSDTKMVKAMYSKGYYILGSLTFIAVNLPWVWYKFYRK